MTSIRLLLLWASVSILTPNVLLADAKVTIAHNDPDEATAAFTFRDVPPPQKNDAADKATFKIIDGQRDQNGADLDAIHSGKIPSQADDPANNFFFSAGTDGGRIVADLGTLIDIKQVDTYSWHPGTRAPQVYKLYASDGSDKTFDAEPKKGTVPSAVGWKLIASVDTRPKQGDPGGQYGVAISEPHATLGKYRYLLFDISTTESDDSFGNTFFSRINILDPQTPIVAAKPVEGVKVLKAANGKYQITLDTSETPDLREWAETELAPVLLEWYPKIVAMLPSDGYEAPRRFSVTFNKDMDGVAYTSGTQIHCAAAWFSKSLKTEAKGAIVHEMVHVVQQYGRARRPNASRPPGWLVEGIPDYVRWYKFEPQSHGADLDGRNLVRAHFDGSYRVSANFLNYVASRYDKDLIEKLNAALRQGAYDSALWKTLTAKSVDELNDEWKEQLRSK